MTTLTKTNNDERVITLYTICKVLNKRHSDAKKQVEELHKTTGFGDYGFLAIEPERGGVKVETFEYTKKQALIVGARLDNSQLIALIDKLEELSKPKSKIQMIADIAIQMVEQEKILNDHSEQLIQHAMELKAIPDTVDRHLQDTLKPVPKGYTSLKEFDSISPVSKAIVKSVINLCDNNITTTLCRTYDDNKILRDFIAYDTTELTTAVSSMIQNSNRTKKTYYSECIRKSFRLRIK